MSRSFTPPVPRPPRPPTLSSPNPGVASRPRLDNGTFQMSRTDLNKIMIEQGFSRAQRQNIGRAIGNRSATTTTVGPGHITNPTTGDTRTPEQTTKQRTEDPNSQHSTEGRARDKRTMGEKIKNWAMAGLIMLPLAVMLAAIVQGGIDCDNINKSTYTVTKVDSAAWPEYPDWWPDWLPAPQKDNGKVWLTYSPGVHILSNDKLTIKTSNTSGDIQTSLTGERTVENNDQDDIVMVAISSENFEPSEFSNVSINFELDTNCLDRMAYQTGENFEAIGETAGDVFSSFTDAIPWKTILYIIIFIAAVYLFIKGVSILRGG